MQTDKEGEGSKAVITILYEDETLLVINKPSGIKVHEDGRTEGETVVDWFLDRAPKARGVGEPGLSQDGKPLERSGVVHRLDKDTSGVLVLAKTQEAFEYLKAEFQERRIRKEYRAFVYGTMKERWGTINRPIGRSARDFRLRSAERGARGLLRPATTDWELITGGAQHSYLKILPKTGRTHQIRVHMKAIGHPIVRDPLYASKEIEAVESLGFSRLALHAFSLTFLKPDGVEEVCTAPLPHDFEDATRALATS